MSKYLIFIIIFILIIIVLVVGVGLWQATAPTAPSYNNNDNQDQIYCTQDVMDCPDGSYVGRVPPTCEFVQCPMQ